MKKITFLLLIISSSFMVQAQAEQINWMSIEEAVEANKKEPRKIMIDVYTKWCGPCKMMMKNTFTNPDVIRYINTHFYAVKFDAESADAVTFKGQFFENPDYNPNATGRNGVHQFSRALQVRAYPTIVYMDEELNIIAPISGYRTPPQLELYLRLVAENAYKTVTTDDQWQAYQANFKPTFN